MLDLSRDFERCSQCATAVLERDHGLLSRAHGLEKRLQFGAERLLVDHLRLQNFDLRICRGHPVLAADGEHQYVLTAVIERNVLMGLEESQLADALGGNSAGSKVSHTPRLELQPDVRYINFIRKNRQSGRTNLTNRRVHEGKHDVEVMNHQIEDYVHIQGTRGKDTQTMNLEEHRLCDQWNRSSHCGIEAL